MPAIHVTAAAAQPMWKRQWAIHTISHRFTFPHSQQQRWYEKIFFTVLVLRMRIRLILSDTGSDPD